MKALGFYEKVNKPAKLDSLYGDDSNDAFTYGVTILQKALGLTSDGRFGKTSSLKAEQAIKEDKNGFWSNPANKNLRNFAERAIGMQQNMKHSRHSVPNKKSANHKEIVKDAQNSISNTFTQKAHPLQKEKKPSEAQNEAENTSVIKKENTKANPSNKEQLKIAIERNNPFAIPEFQKPGTIKHYNSVEEAKQEIVEFLKEYAKEKSKINSISLRDALHAFESKRTFEATGDTRISMKTSTNINNAADQIVKELNHDRHKSHFHYDSQFPYFNPENKREISLLSKAISAYANDIPFKELPSEFSIGLSEQSRSGNFDQNAMANNTMIWPKH